MKKTKILSLILTLCMTASVFAAGKLGVSAAEVAGTQTEVGEDAYKDNWEPIGIQSCDEMDGAFSKLYTFAKSQISTMKLYDDYDFSLCHVIATDLGKTADYACVGYFVMKLSKVNRWLDLLGSKYGSEYVKYNGIINAVVRIHANEEGELKSIAVSTIDLDNPETADPVPAYRDYPWICMDKTDAKVENSLSTAVKEALDGYDKLKLSVISEVGKKEDSGTDHRFMCYGTASVEFPNTYVYIVDVHEENNTAEINNVQFFDINGYVTSLTTHNKEETTATNPQNNSNTTDNSETKNTVTEIKSNTGSATNDSAVKSNDNTNIVNTSAGKSYDSTNNANGSIATGQSSVAATMALVLIVMIPAVLFLFRKRKNY